MSAKSYAELDATCVSTSGLPHSRPNRRDDSVRAQPRPVIDDLTREEFSYILDTLPVLRSKELAASGEYQFKRKALEEYESFQNA